MYTPISNAVVNAAMRWPAIGLAIATFVGLFSENVFAQTGGWLASVALAVYAILKNFGDEFCECDEENTRKGLGMIPRVTWVVEYNEESGSKRPWELYSMFGNDEDTKQHYASYASEDHALKKKELLEKTIGVVSGKDKEQ